MTDTIQHICAREILNARGMPTVEAEVTTKQGHCGVASVPSGTSKGRHEAHELYDGGSRYRGFGVRRAVDNVNRVLGPALVGYDVTCQAAIDHAMITLDGTPNKSNLGANAILPVSVAVAKACAASRRQPLFQSIATAPHPRLPHIVATVIAGGVYSGSGLEFEDYLYVLDGFDDFETALEALCEMRWRLEQNLRALYGDFAEDGGALSPPLATTEAAFDCMLQAAHESGCDKQVSLGLDVAAAELFDPADGRYRMAGQRLSAPQLMQRYTALCRAYPLNFLEDAFDQDAFDAFAQLKAELPDVMIVGDDLFATNPARLRQGIQANSANAVLLKINQIGTLTEALAVEALARQNGYDTVVSLRSGETTDDFIADLAVGIAAKQIKLGSPVRAERNAKYNRLLRIARELL
jgi:enolase